MSNKSNHCITEKTRSADIYFGGRVRGERMNLPKQLPLKGMNILQAVAIGNSTERMVLIIQSSIFIINAAKIKHIIIGNVIS